MIGFNIMIKMIYIACSIILCAASASFCQLPEGFASQADRQDCAEQCTRELVYEFDHNPKIPDCISLHSQNKLPYSVRIFQVRDDAYEVEFKNDGCDTHYAKIRTAYNDKEEPEAFITDISLLHGMKFDVSDAHQVKEVFEQLHCPCLRASWHAADPDYNLLLMHLEDFFFINDRRYFQDDFPAVYVEQIYNKEFDKYCSIPMTFRFCCVRASTVA